MNAVSHASWCDALGTYGCGAPRANGSSVPGPPAKGLRMATPECAPSGAGLCAVDGQHRGRKVVRRAVTASGTGSRLKGLSRPLAGARRRPLFQRPYWMPTTTSRFNVVVSVAAGPLTVSPGLAAVIR
jgi:hypothetical protein